jgi:hypothetical protein
MTYSSYEKHDSQLSLAAGGISSSASISVWGFGLSYTTAPTIITSIKITGNSWDPADANTVLELNGDSTDDAAAGIGAREVTVYGIDEFGAEETEVVTCPGNGTSSALSTNWRAVNSMVVTSAGSSKTNEGTLTLRVSGGGSIWARIQPGYSRSSQVRYRAPAGKRVFLRSLEICAQDHGVFYNIWVYMYDPTTDVKHIVFHTETSDGPNPQRWDLGGRVLPAGSEVAVLSKSNIGGTINIYCMLQIETAP